MKDSNKETLSLRDICKVRDTIIAASQDDTFWIIDACEANNIKVGNVSFWGIRRIHDAQSMIMAAINQGNREFLYTAIRYFEDACKVESTVDHWKGFELQCAAELEKRSALKE